MGRRHAIFFGVACGLLLLLVPAMPLFDRVPELLIPALAAYLMALAFAFRVLFGQSLLARALAAKGIAAPRAPRRGRWRRVGGALARSFWALWVLVAATVAALWLRSHRVTDRVDWARWDVLGVTPSRWVRRDHHRMTLVSDSGVLSGERFREVILDAQYVLDKDAPLAPKPWERTAWTDDSAARALGVTIPRGFRTARSSSKLLDKLGVEYGNFPRPPRFPGDPWEGTTLVAVPWRVIFLAAALPPLLAGAVYLSRLRFAKPGHCRNCGYDLRATPGRCPECGEEPRDVPVATVQA